MHYISISQQGTALGTGMLKDGRLRCRADLLLEGSHARDEEEGRELDGALHVKVRLRQGLQELPEGGREEGVVLLLAHLRTSSAIRRTAFWSLRLFTVSSPQSVYAPTTDAMDCDPLEVL